MDNVDKISVYDDPALFSNIINTIKHNDPTPGERRVSIHYKNNKKIDFTTGAGTKRPNIESAAAVAYVTVSMGDNSRGAFFINPRWSRKKAGALVASLNKSFSGELKNYTQYNDAGADLAGLSGFTVHGFFTISNGGGVAVELSDDGDSVRYSFYNGRPSRPQLVKYTPTGRPYFTARGRRWYIENFLKA